MKKLLLLASLMLGGGGVFAQDWATAQWEAPEFPAATENVEDIVGEKIFLYNKDAGGFLRGYGTWGSRAGVDTSGIDTVIIQKPFKTSVANGTTASNIDEQYYPYWMDEDSWNGKSYIIQNYASHIGAPRWDEMFYKLFGFDEIWIDRQANALVNTSFFWDIEKSENDSYYIKSSKSVPLLRYWDELAVNEGLATENEDGTVTNLADILGGERLGVNLDDTSRGLCFEGLDANIAYGWSFVTIEAYKAADKASLYEEVKRYNTAVTLKLKIDAGVAKCPEADFSQPKNTYNNTASSIDELNEAIELVNQIIIAYQEGLATPDNPADMSDAIVNGTFDTDASGWKGTAFGHDSECAEHYNKNYHTWQNITNLPVGLYAVSVRGIYRAGLTADDWETRDNPQMRNAVFYATSGTDSLVATLVSLSSVATDIAGLSTATVGDDALYVPENMPTFANFNNAGLIPEIKIIVPVFDGTLRIGIQKTKSVNRDWTIVDDFELKYYGNSQEAYYAWRDQAVENAPTVESFIPDEETYYTYSYLAAYEEAVSGVKNTTEIETLSSKITAIQSTADSLSVNIDAWKTYMLAVESISNEIYSQDLVGDSANFLSDYFISEDEPGDYPNGGHLYIIEQRTISTNALNEECDYLRHLLETAIRTGVQDGSDATNMLVNPSFADGWKGWTNSSGGTPTGNVGGEAFYPNVEVFNGVVDVCQTVNDVPAGIYSVSIQAFERPKDNGSYDGTEESKVFVFMNDFQSPIMNIVDNALPVDEAITEGSGQNCLVSNDYKFNDTHYVPNGMKGASYAFAGGSASYPAGTRYLNKCYGIVGDDGVMKIGLTSNGVNAHWTLWANFRLTYEGKNDDAMAEILTATIEKAYTYLDGTSGTITNPVTVVLLNAISASEDVDGYDACYAAYVTLNKVIADAETNIEAYAELLTAVEKMKTTYEATLTTATQEALDLCDEMTAKANESMDLDTDEVKALTEEVKYAAAALIVPIVEGASDDNPVDMTSVIINADFTNGADDGSWTYEKNGGNGPKFDNAFDGSGFEFWNGTVANLAFDIYQVLLALPEGKYALTADLTNSLNGQNQGANGGRVHLYAMVFDETGSTTYAVPVEIQSEDANIYNKTYEVVFDVPAGAKVQVGAKTVGTMDARWVVGDTFTLKYFGSASSKENSGDSTPIESVENADSVVPVAVYNISGTRVATPVKGINIVRMSDGTVKKVLIK